MTPFELVAYQKQWAKNHPGCTNVDYAKDLHPHPPMSPELAALALRQLVHRYGLHWTACVPAEACALMSEIDRVLTEDSKRSHLFGA